MAPNLPALAVYLVVVVGLVGVHLFLTASSGFRLSEETKRVVGVTPATTISRAYNHLIAGFFHGSLIHLGFNLLVFSIAFPLATRGFDPVRTVVTAYVISPATVLSLHLLAVLPLARAGWPYAVRALDYPLVGFSVIAYATLGMALVGLDRTWALGAAAFVVLFEIAAGIGFTGPFVSVYHLVGLGLGAYVRWLSTTPLGAA